MRTTRRVLVGAIAAFALLTTPAAATSVTVGCTELQSTLNAATEGEVITLDQLCSSGFPYKLPNMAVTLTGTAGAGFDGGSTVQLEGGEAPATIEGLTFENAKSSGITGGALDLDAQGKAIDFALSGDVFQNDEVAGKEGGGGGAFIDTEGQVTVTGSTFTGDSAYASEASGGGLDVYAARADLSGDSFSADDAGDNGFGGGLSESLTGTGSTLSDSVFTGDTATDEGGGAVVFSQAPSGLALTMSGDTFAHDSVADPAGTSVSFNGYSGGGFSFSANKPVTLAQSGDSFEANTVSFKPAAMEAAGGGESVSNAELLSTGDRFTDNALQSPDEAKNKSNETVWGWGAGLSIVACGDVHASPPSVPNVSSTLSDAVVAGNTLLSGPTANGAGIYVGVLLCETGYTILHLDDSTVAGNTISGAAGPVAGISGGPSDVLSLANTIVYGDSGGNELGGFGGLASVSAAYSDVCSGASPFAGTGNICADPRLVGPGSGSADVHETSASPTLNAGSNALVPTGLTTDVFGDPRFVAAPVCSGSPAAIVDIGAAEFGGPFLPISCPPPSHGGPEILIAPALSGLHETAAVWREGSALARLSSARAGKGKHRPPVGTTFSFALNETAQLTFTFDRSVSGRRAGRKCVARTRANRNARRCTRTDTAGAMHLSAPAGSHKLRFDGMVSEHERLLPGSYTLLVTAANAGGHSATGVLHFKIVG